MSCYSSGYRKCCNSYIAFISVVMFLLSVGVIALGALQTGQVVPADAKTVGLDINISQSGYALPVMVVGLLTLLTAMLGCCVCSSDRCKCHKACFAVPFGIVTFVMGVALIVLGLLAVSAGSLLTPETFKGPICSSARAQDAVAAYASAIDKVMCSDECPCAQGAGRSTQELWGAIDSAVLRKYARAANKGQMTSTENKAYQAQGVEAPVVPFTWKQDGAYTSWGECYNQVLKTQQEQTDASERTASQKQADAFFERGGFNFLKQIEHDFDCAGICTVPLFYVTKELSTGPPKRECIEAMFDTITSGMSALGVIALITGFFTFAGFIGSFALCGGAAATEEEEEENRNQQAIELAR